MPDQPDQPDQPLPPQAFREQIWTDPSGPSSVTPGKSRFSPRTPHHFKGIVIGIVLVLIAIFSLPVVLDRFAGQENKRQQEIAALLETNSNDVEALAPSGCTIQVTQIGPYIAEAGRVTMKVNEQDQEELVLLRILGITNGDEALMLLPPGSVRTTMIAKAAGDMSSSLGAEFYGGTPSFAGSYTDVSPISSDVVMISGKTEPFLQLC